MFFILNKKKVSVIIRGKLGSIFFTLDTLIAGLIIMVTVILVLSINYSKPVVEDTSHEVTNYINFLSKTTMKDIRDNYAFAYDAAYEQDLGLYVHQKVFKLVDEGNESEATALIGGVTNFIIPRHFGFRYAVGDTVVYEDNVHLLNNNLSKTSITSRILTYYVNESADSSVVRWTTTNISVWS